MHLFTRKNTADVVTLWHPNDMDQQQNPHPHRNVSEDIILRRSEKNYKTQPIRMALKPVPVGWANERNVLRQVWSCGLNQNVPRLQLHEHSVHRYHDSGNTRIVQYFWEEVAIPKSSCWEGVSAVQKHWNTINQLHQRGQRSWIQTATIRGWIVDRRLRFHEPQ